MPTDIRSREQQPDGALETTLECRPGERGEDRLDSLEWLIDNAEAYERLMRAIRAAQHSVWIAQLAFDADCAAYPRAPHSALPPCPPSPGELLVEALLAAAVHGRTEIRILLNATLLLDTAKPLRRFLRAAGAAARRIHVRGASRFPQLLHAKIVIVDGAEAFLPGSPFVNGYWDDERHRPVDARRPARELGGRPLHDVSMRVTGAVVRDLEAIYDEMWGVAGTASAATSSPPPALQPRASAPAAPARRSESLRMVRTVPRRVLPLLPEGATGILDACVEGIARARSLIYIEHQYLSARPVLAALADALRRAPALEVVMVLNQNPDVTAYRAWQNDRLARWGLLGHPRVGAFALWSAEAQAGRGGATAVNQVFVHSKVVAVDDAWATVGSANLDGVSLYSYGDDFDGRLARRVFRHVRNFDVNVVVDDGAGGAGGAPRTGSVADLRVRLWSEHLGLPPDDVATRPAGGWLWLWRERAARNVAALGEGCRSRSMAGFVLPYSPRATPREQLADVGVRLTPGRLDVRFDPGWLEVHFSPGWVRNMFL